MNLERAILVIVTFWDEYYGKEIDQGVTEYEQCPYIVLTDDGHAIGYVGRKHIQDGAEFILDPSTSDIIDIDEGHGNVFHNKMAEHMGVESATIQEILAWTKEIA